MWVDVLIILAEVSFLYFPLKRNLSRGTAACALNAHLVDFPGAICPAPETNKALSHAHCDFVDRS